MENFTKIWNNLRKEGKHLTKYPYDFVVSFVFRYAPKNKPKKDIKVLDIGCGIGNHLWFLAKEGFDAYGIDGSKIAIEFAKKLLKEFGVNAKLKLHDFTKPFPFEKNFFDLIIDRSALTCISYKDMKRTLDEIHRILKPGGYFLFTPYSKHHTSYTKSKNKKSSFINVESGSLKGTGWVCFYDENDIKNIIDPNKWKVCSLIENISHDKINDNVDAMWIVILKKL